MKIRRLIAAPALLLALSSATPALADQLAAAVPGPRGVVTRQELMDSHRVNAYDFVRLNRPQWLRTRGYSAVAAPVMVYVDGNRMGDTNVLRTISTTEIAEIRFLDGREATTRYGSNHNNGAILVSTGVRVEEPSRSETAETAARF